MGKILPDLILFNTIDDIDQYVYFKKKPNNRTSMAKLYVAVYKLIYQKAQDLLNINIQKNILQ